MAKRTLCRIEGCAKARSRTSSLCSMHLARKKRHGDPLHERPKAEPRLNVNGYLVMSLREHPLADAHGKVYVHRVVLYEAIGPGGHHCHWCHRRLAWDASDGRQLITDHVNEVKTDNRIENLVPACTKCNITRSGHYRLKRSACLRGHEFTPENARIDRRGRRICRVCARIRAAERKASRAEA